MSAYHIRRLKWILFSGIGIILGGVWITASIPARDPRPIIETKHPLLIQFDYDYDVDGLKFRFTDRVELLDPPLSKFQFQVFNHHDFQRRGRGLAYTLQPEGSD